MGSDRISLSLYAKIFKKIPKKSEHDGNHPSDFEQLKESEKNVLLYSACKTPCLWGVVTHILQSPLVDMRYSFDYSWHVTFIRVTGCSR